MDREQALILMEAVERRMGERCAVHLISTMGREERAYHVEVRWGYLVGSDLAALNEIGQIHGYALEVSPTPRPEGPGEATCARFRDYVEGGRA